VSLASVEDAAAEAERIGRDEMGARIPGTLVIRFISAEPDLRVPAPPIPG
jgi:hypothetical protein